MVPLVILSLSGLVELGAERLDAFTIINSFCTVNDGKKNPQPTRTVASRTRHDVTHTAIVHTVLFPKYVAMTALIFSICTYCFQHLSTGCWRTMFQTLDAYFGFKQ